MKYHDWDEDKNMKLIQERGVSFEMCLAYIEQGEILDIIENKTPYEHQRVYVLEMDKYVYYVPFVEDKEKFFLRPLSPAEKRLKSI